MALVLSVLNPSGGNGCTFFTSFLSSFFAVNGNRVLMVDLDPMATLSRVHEGRMGLLTGESVSYSLHGKDELIPGYVGKNLHLVRSDLSLCGVPKVLDVLPEGRYELQRRLVALQDDYDLIVIDCAPSLDILSLSALSVAHRVVMPVNARSFCSAAIEAVSAFCKSEGVDGGVTDIVLNHHDPREALCRQSESFLRETYGSLVLSSTVRRSVLVSEAANLSVDVFDYSCGSMLLSDLKSVGKEMFARIELI